jgi:RNA polymerase sigma-70 factor (ECF subfamily)
VSLSREPDDRPDSGLIRRFLEGDEQSFRLLYRRHSPRLRAIIARLLGTRRSDTDDVLQETWLAACRALHQYRGDARFGTWLTTIGIRTARARLLVRPMTAVLEEDLPSTGSADAPETIDLERALARLPDHQRLVLVLHDVEGFTHDEIAAQLGVAPGTSKVTLSRARQAMRRLLNDGVPLGC